MILMMIEILHDLMYQNLRDNSSIVNVGYTGFLLSTVVKGLRGGRLSLIVAIHEGLN